LRRARGNQSVRRDDQENARSVGGRPGGNAGRSRNGRCTFDGVGWRFHYRQRFPDGWRSNCRLLVWRACTENFIALSSRRLEGQGETHAYDLTQVLQILDRLPLIAKGLVATAAFAGLRLGELRGLEWTDYIGAELTINRSIRRSVISPPKTRASRNSVPVIPALAEILDEYRRSMGNPETGVVFHSGNRRPINADKLGRRVIRPTLEAIDLPWYGWHAFRRGLASNLYAMGAPDKVQRILRHSKPHVTKEHYIKVFDSTVVEAVDKMQAQIEELRKAQGDRQQLELRFVDDQPATSAPECSMGNGFPHFSKARPAVGQQILSSWVGSD
jgi:hypothetical protein